MILTNIKQKHKLLLGIFAVCFASAFILACNGKGRSSILDSDEVMEDSLLEDSIESSADTLLLDLETLDEPIPESVDELFDDFLFSFEQSNRMQRSRIHFPLPIVQANGETHYLQRHEWSHHYLFLHQDYCTVLWNTRQQMTMAQDTSVCEARVDQIYLHSKIIESYSFQRDSISHDWMLTEISKIPFSHTDLAPFLDFYRDFATDSIFQRRHITDPLSFATNDGDDYDMVRGTINADQWFEFRPDLPQDILVHIAYGQTYRQRHQILMQFRGINNGLQTLLVFRRDGDQWRLTELEN